MSTDPTTNLLGRTIDGDTIRRAACRGLHGGCARPMAGQRTTTTSSPGAVSTAPTSSSVQATIWIRLPSPPWPGGVAQASRPSPIEKPGSAGTSSGRLRAARAAGRRIDVERLRRPTVGSAGSATQTANHVPVSSQRASKSAMGPVGHDLRREVAHGLRCATRRPTRRGRGRRRREARGRSATADGDAPAGSTGRRTRSALEWMQHEAPVAGTGEAVTRERRCLPADHRRPVGSTAGCHSASTRDLDAGDGSSKNVAASSRRIPPSESGAGRVGGTTWPSSVGRDVDRAGSRSRGRVDCSAPSAGGAAREGWPRRPDPAAEQVAADPRREDAGVIDGQRVGPGGRRHARRRCRARTSRRPGAR